MVGDLFSASLSGIWTGTGSLNTARYKHTANLLANGKVLVAGGYDGNAVVSTISTTELYDATDWTPTPVILSYATKLPDGAFQFNFAGNPNGTNIVLATTNLALPVTDWTSLGKVAEIQPGLYLLTDPQATNHDQRFYVVRTP